MKNVVIAMIVVGVAAALVINYGLNQLELPESDDEMDYDYE